LLAYLLQIFLDLCSLMTFVFLFAFALRIVQIVFCIVISLLKREPIDKEDPSINLLKYFRESWNDKESRKTGKAIMIVILIGLVHFIDLISIST